MSVRPAWRGTRSRQEGIDNDAVVFGDRPLRAGVARVATARFGDLVWDLSPAVFQRHNRKLILNFAAVPERFRLAAKELCYALLAGEPPPGQLRLHVVTIHGHFGKMQDFLTWVDQRGVAALGALTADDLAAYQEHLRKRPGATAQWRQRQRHVVRLFWVYRARLTTDTNRLSLDPDGLEAWDDESRWNGKGENRTERIPEAVLGPLLGWALRWVDEFANDVVDAHDEWMALNANTSINRQRRRRPHARDVPTQLEALLARYRAERRPLPATTTGVNYSHLARELNCSRKALEPPPMRALLEEAVRDLGLAEGTWLRAEVHGQVNGRPWRGAIGYEELPGLVRQLHIACYIVIAYLSGMRESEVKHLRRGCLATRRDNTGRAYRHVITSQAFKGEGGPEGVEATWVVGKPVQRAVDVLERLHPPGQDLLFAHPPSSRHFQRHRQPADRARQLAQTNLDLAAFVDWINANCDTHRLPDRIPLVAGQRWHLTTSQFRRTLAWFIARRPGGVIAGAIQYRHQRVQMFEGYAGTSASGFRAEVEAEQALERGEHLLTMVEGHEHHQLGGPAADEARARLEEFRRHADACFTGTVVTDERRLQLIMRRHDPSIYPGKFITCIHNADKALCHRSKGNRKGPVLPDCRPLDCRNVALTPANLAAWRAQLARLDQALASTDVLAPYLRHRLTEQRDQITRFLDEAVPAPKDSP
jgi:integrase